MPPSQRDQRACVVEQFVIDGGPVEPGYFVILTVRVVVASLGPSRFIARQKHRHSLRQEQRSQEVSHLPRAQRVDARIVGWSFSAAVPRTVVVLAVPVLLAVRLVVLLVVGDQVSQRESVVAGDKVDAGARLAA